jgi:hypothetical protein
MPGECSGFPNNPAKTGVYPDRRTSIESGAQLRSCGFTYSAGVADGGQGAAAVLKELQIVV